MAGTTVRISVASRNALRALAVQSGESMQAILDRAIENYRRYRFLEEVNTAYAAVRQDARAWSALKKELKEWDGTLKDGLEADEPWTEGGEGMPRGKKGKGRG